MWLCKYVCVDRSVFVYPMCPPPKRNTIAPTVPIQAGNWSFCQKVLIGSKIIHHWHLQLSQLTPGHPWQWRHFCAQRRVKYTRPTWTWRWMAIAWRKRSVSAPVKLKLFVSVGWVVFLMITHPKTNMAMETHHFWLEKMLGFSIVMLESESLMLGLRRIYRDSRIPYKKCNHHAGDCYKVGGGGRSKIEGLLMATAFCSAKHITLWRISMISPQIQMRRDRCLSLLRFWDAPFNS